MESKMMIDAVCRRLSRNEVIAIVLLLAFALLCGFFYYFPSYPREWNRIKIGMSVAQAHAIEPRLNDMRLVKGFDSASHGSDEAWWTLMVYVDENDRIHRVVKQYTVRSHGLFNRSIVDE